MENHAGGWKGKAMAIPYRFYGFLRTAWREFRPLEFHVKGFPGFEWSFKRVR